MTYLLDQDRRGLLRERFFILEWNHPGRNMMDSAIYFNVWVSKNKISSNVYADCETSVQPAIFTWDHKWSKCEGCRKESTTGLHTPLSLILPPLISQCDLLQNRPFHIESGMLLLFFLSLDKNLLWGFQLCTLGYPIARKGSGLEQSDPNVAESRVTFWPSPCLRACDLSLAERIQLNRNAKVLQKGIIYLSSPQL